MPPSSVCGCGETHNLPVALTPLLGRSHELEETQRLLANARLLTITGAGGSGKTRLAVELARLAAPRFEGGTVWVDLAPVADPSLVAQQLLDAFCLREVPTREVIQVVIDCLRERSVLLVFDNCEHLVDDVAAVAELILRSCPATSILATSREALGIAGEQTWLVPPLAEPDAMQLFVERARAASPSFALRPDNEESVVRICRRLDGIPLAIELAAARVRVLSVGQIADRLGDAFRLLSSGSRTVPRHRTIRETIDWSYRLLDPEEQTLLRRLAVFSGSFCLPATEAISGHEHVLELLSALVEKSLVLYEPNAREARYRLLDTVRQFAAEKLAQAGESDSYRQRHAGYYVDLIENAEPRIFAGAVDPPTLAAIDAEIGNIRAVFDWAEERQERVEPELRLLYALHWYWFARAHFHEARRRIDAAMIRARGVDPLVRARAILASADAAVWQADWSAVRPSIDEAVKILRERGTHRERAMALTLLGIALAFAEGDAAASEKAFDESLAAARENGRDVALAMALYWRGAAAQLFGDWKSARAVYEEAYSIGVDLDNKPAIGHSSTVLGHVALREGKHAEAIACFRRALEVHAEIDDRWGLTQVVEGIGLALLDTGDAEVGTRLLAAAAAAWLKLGARPGRDEDFEREKDDRIRQALGDDRLRVILASGAAMPYDEMVSLARTHVDRLGGAATAPVADRRRIDGGAPVLTVRALGPLEIIRGSETLDAASQSARSRELLLFLLCRPAGATKEQIGAALWPDVDGTKLRNNFHVTVHRLRKMLGGPEWVVAEGDTYSLKPGIDFDVTTFEREIRSNDLSRLAAALDLYRGDFLENASAGEWHEEVRDRLRDLHASALTTLGRAHMSSGDFASAASIYQRLVTFDPLDEQATRNLMTCFSRLGDVSGATRAYRRLTDALRRELDAEPDPGTARLHERIVAGGG